MNKSGNHIQRFALFWIIAFILYYAWYAWYGLLLHQVKPVIFFNKVDFTTNIIFTTGIQQAVLKYQWVRWLLDILFVFLPVLLYVCVYTGKFTKIAAVVTSLFILAYGLISGTVTFISPETLSGFVLTALLFYDSNERNYYFRFHALRYLFVLFFFSAGIWKLADAGLFNTNEMSAILMEQHKQILAETPHTVYASFINWLILKPLLSWSFYAGATVLELVFVIGFFTKKYDKLLLLLLLAFIIFDLLLMRINYFAWVSYAGLFYFSEYVKEEA